MSDDLPFQVGPDSLHDALDGRIPEFLDGAAIDADGMVMMVPSVGGRVPGFAVGHCELADDCGIDQQFQRSIDRRPPNVWQGRTEFLRGKAIGLADDNFRDTPTRAGEAISAVFEDGEKRCRVHSFRFPWRGRRQSQRILVFET